MPSKRRMESQTSQIVSENEHKQLWHRAIKFDNAKPGKMNDNRQRHPKWEGRLPLQSSQIIPSCMIGEQERSIRSFHPFEVVKVGRQ